MMCALAVLVCILMIFFSTPYKRKEAEAKANTVVQNQAFVGNIDHNKPNIDHNKHNIDHNISNNDTPIQSDNVIPNKPDNDTTIKPDNDTTIKPDNDTAIKPDNDTPDKSDNDTSNIPDNETIRKNEVQTNGTDASLQKNPSQNEALRPNFAENDCSDNLKSLHMKGKEIDSNLQSDQVLHSDKL